jgi:hypothetical protein
MQAGSELSGGLGFEVRLGELLMLLGRATVPLIRDDEGDDQ